jgi:carboxypeptidase Q
LSLESKRLPDAPSANVLAELRGRESPEQIVVIGAHLDSWDVGAGAHDDGAGCVMMMEALRILRQSGLIPRRTIRLVLFTNEENGTAGGDAYFEAHKHELGNHVWALESDHGAFRPRGFLVKAPHPVLAVLSRLRPLFQPVSGAEMIVSTYTGVDIGPLVDAGVPGVGIINEGAHYFEIIHSEADTLDKVNPQDLANGVAATALMAYILADHRF